MLPSSLTFIEVGCVCERGLGRIEPAEGFIGRGKADPCKTKTKRKRKRGGNVMWVL
jgi:hypothetical protein